MKKLLRVFVVACVIVILLFVALLVYVRVVFPPEKLRETVLTEMEKRTGREIYAGDIRFRIFPRIGLELNDFRISNPDDFSEAHLLRLKRFFLIVQLMPLFERRIEVQRILLVEPEFFVEINEQGISNLQFPTEPPEKEGTVSDEKAVRKGAPASPFYLILSAFRIENGTISFRDHGSDLLATLTGIEQSTSLSFDRTLESVGSTGRVSIDDISLRSPAFDLSSIGKVNVALDYDLQLNMPAETMILRNCLLRMQEIELSAKGSVKEFISSIPVVDLELRTQSLDLSAVLRSVPKEMVPALGGIDAAGDVALKFTLKGPLEPSFPLKGEVRIRNGKITHEQFPATVHGIDTVIRITDQSLFLDECTMKFQQNPVAVRGRIDNFKNPSVTVHAEGELDLSSLDQLFQLPEAAPVIDSGKVKATLSAEGRIRESPGLAVNGNVILSNIEARLPDHAVPVRVTRGECEFDSEHFSISPLVLLWGSSDAEIHVRVTDYVSLLDPDSLPVQFAHRGAKPRAEVKITSSILNVGELKPQGGDNTPKEKSQPVQKTAVPPIPNIEFNGEVKIDTLLMEDFRAHNLKLTMGMSDRIASVQQASMNLYSGILRATGTLNLKDTATQPFEIRFSAEKVRANDFLSRMTRFGDHLYGTLTMNADFSGEFDDFHTLSREALDGRGKATVTDCRVVNWEPLRKIGEVIRYGRWDEFGIRNWSGGFAVRNGRIYFDEMKATGETGDWEVSGSAGFDSTLDMELEARLSRSISNKVSGSGIPGTLTSLVKDDQGRLRTAFLVRGTVQDPEVTVDDSVVRDRLSKEKDRLEAELREKKREAAGKAEQALKEKKKKAEAQARRKKEEVKEDLKEMMDGKKEKVEDELKKLFR
jgi:hypothetical protein